MGPFFRQIMSTAFNKASIGNTFRLLKVFGKFYAFSAIVKSYESWVGEFFSKSKREVTTPTSEVQYR